MSPFGKNLSVVGFIAMLAGCEFNKPTTDGPGYEKIDNNHFLIDGWDSDLRRKNLPESLAKFREEVPGDFLLVPEHSGDFLSGDMLAVRKVVDSAGEQKNSVEFSLTGE